MMIIYPLVILKGRTIKIIGVTVSIAAIIVLTIVGILHPPVYSTEVMINNEEHPFNDTYKVSLADDRYGTAEIVYMNQLEDFMVHCDFKKAGNTVLILEAPDGVKTEHAISITRDTYEVQ